MPAAVTMAGPSALRISDNMNRSSLKQASNFVIPTITVSPPTEPPQYSTMAPEQFYDKTVLFVPVKTEELGWDEHGLYWNGTYAYPIHNIYDKQGRPIGRRRKGPVGYRFEEYFDFNRGRSVPQTPDQVEMIESEILDPFMQQTAEVVEEASVNLTEPAPARIETPESTTSTVIVTEPVQVDAPMDDPTSPTLSTTSDTSESEASSSICDDESSLWSRIDNLSDDEASVSTSPGTLSPVFAPNSECEMLKADMLSSKLAQVASTPNSYHSNVLSTSDSSSPTPKAELPVAVDVSSTRIRSDLIAPSNRAFKSRKAEPSFSSLIHDLSTSPFSSDSSPLSTLSRSKTTRASSTSAPRSSVIVRSSSLSHSSTRRPARRTLDLDFSGGWQFENESRQLSTSWQQTFLDD